MKPTLRIGRHFEVTTNGRQQKERIRRINLNEVFSSCGVSLDVFMKVKLLICSKVDLFLIFTELA